MAQVRIAIAGIPIHLTASWALVTAYIAYSLSAGYFPRAYPGWPTPIHWMLGIAAALLLFGCILLHELGHSLVARRHHVPVSGVTLFFFGGVSEMTGRPRRPADELRIALAGPLVSALLGVGCAWAGALVHPERFTAALLSYLATINIGLALFNLMPAFPLDGGRVVRAVLWAVTKNISRATRAASLVGAAFGLALLAFGAWLAFRGAWGTGIWYMLLGWFLRSAALRSYRSGFG